VTRNREVNAESGAQPDRHSAFRIPHSALILARLRGRYGELRWRPHGDAITELVLTILSQHTNDMNSGRAFAEMQRAYPSWDAVVEADPAALADSIRQGGLANQKAPRIQQALARIKEERGGWDLDFLRGLPLDEAKAWLRALPGVGPKTAACVLLFALGRPALPVDTHVYRVSRRLGLIDARVSADQAHTALEQQVPAADVYAFHVALIKLGRYLCTARKPNCGGCPLNDICPSAFYAALEAAPA
jgi:endonuclease-3